MAKDIIKTLVSNDQVIAICKLRAEEIERHKQEGKKNFKKQLLFDSPDGIKMTRNKARYRSPQERHPPNQLTLTHSTSLPGSSTTVLAVLCRHWI